MGTSTHNGGQKGGTPLVPSWLQQPDENMQNETSGTQIPPMGNVDRFTAPRGEFTRYINSGGRDSSLGRKSVSNYISKSLGGSSNATQRMGAARSSTARLLNIAGAFASGGARAVEQYLSIENATSREEIGNPPHHGTVAKLRAEGIPVIPHRAVQMTLNDYEEYDYLIGMDTENIRNMQRISGGDPDEKIYKLLTFTGSGMDVADPWYTGDFEATYRDVKAGCEGLLSVLREELA
jgi:protein-tyrosine phosphatase